jgi:hypothetical protein
MCLEGLGKFKKSNELVGNRTRDLPACSRVPQLSRSLNLGAISKTKDQE